MAGEMAGELKGPGFVESECGDGHGVGADGDLTRYRRVLGLGAVSVTNVDLGAAGDRDGWGLVDHQEADPGASQEPDREGTIAYGAFVILG